jgi:WD40 repeat protein
LLLLVVGLLNALKDVVLCVDISDDGSKILTGSRDNTAKLWSIDGKLLKTLKEHRDFINVATFSPDGGYVLTGDSNGKVILWKIEKLLNIITIRILSNQLIFNELD